MRYLIIAFWVSAIIMGCETESSLTASETNTAQNSTFSYIEEKVFRPRCAFSGCHSSDSKSSNLDLSTANAYSNLVNVKSILSTKGYDRVEPGNSGESYLIKVLDGSDPTTMPLGSPGLDQSTINLIAKWIDEGALNN